MKKLLCLISILYALQGCCITPSPVSVQDLQRVNRIGVISLIGDKVGMKLAGTTAFTNKNYYRKIEGLNIDEQIRKTVKNRLGNDFEFVDFTYDITRAAQIYPYKDGSGLGTGRNIDKIESYLHEISREYNIDTLILITRRNSDNAWSVNTSGLNIFTHFFLGKQVDTQFTYQAKYIVFDLKTMKSLSSTGIYCIRSIPGEYWLRKSSSFQADQKSFIQDLIINFVEENTELGLAKLGLIDPSSKECARFGCDDGCFQPLGG